MLIKIDLGKAYNRISWSFIRNTLEKVSLPSDWIRDVMHCIETMKMSIIWNGRRLEWFKPTREMLFLCTFFSLYGEVRQYHYLRNGRGRWAPVKLSWHEPPLSHLYFADDLILFLEASESQMEVIMDCLDLFCAASG